MAVGATFRVVDKYAKKMKREASGPQLSLKVGVIKRTAETLHPKTGIPIGDVAFYNEFGTMTIPARSFLRDWVDNNIDRIAKTLGNDRLRALMTNESFAATLNKRGKEYREKIVRRIERSIPPPNAESTILAKGSDIPLIDTETLIAAITYEVKKSES